MYSAGGGRKFFDTTSAGKLHLPTHRKNDTSLKVQSFVDEKLRGIFMVCYKSFGQYPYYLDTERNPTGKESLDCQGLYLNVERQTDQVLVIALDLQVTRAVKFRGGSRFPGD